MAPVGWLMTRWVAGAATTVLGADITGGKLGVRLERELAGGVVFDVVEGRDAGDDLGGHRAGERAAAAGLRNGDHGGVVGGFDVAKLIDFIDYDG